MKQISVIFSMITAVFFISCTEKYDVSLIDAKTNRLVVEGSVTSEYKVHQIKLTRTGSYFLNEPTRRETGAQVSISDEDTLINLFDFDEKGIYKTDIPFAGKPGKNYTLNIKLGNGESYSASEWMKPLLPIDSVKCVYKKSDIPFDTKFYYNINIFVQEPPDKGDCYQWELYLNEKYVSDTIRTKTFVTDDMVNGSYIANWTVYQIPDYKIEKDTVTVHLQMLSISRAKYDYYLAILYETDFSGAGFVGPPANVPSNISNGALGFFSVSDVTEIETVIYRAVK